MLKVFRIPQLSMNTICLTRWNIEYNLSMLLDFFEFTVFDTYKMLNNIEYIDMISLLSYSVHAAQGDFSFVLAEFSVYERPKVI